MNGRWMNVMKSLWGLVGCLAVLVWVSLFGGGMLVDSCSYRQTLDPQVQCAQRGKVPEGRVGAASLQLTLPSLPFGSLGQRGDDLSSVASAFFKSLLLYTPLNIALLAIIAGFIGGCASRAAHGPLPDATVDPTRAAFLVETPFASALRGFIVYLAIVGGAYAAIGNPFQGGEAQASIDTYARLGGIISFLALAVGYDPTRLTGILDMMPGRTNPSPAK